MWNLISVRLETVFVLVQDGCMVCTECTIKQFWTHSIELQGDVGHVKSHFDPFGDNISVGAR
jgi:hypothetical protein